MFYFTSTIANLASVTVGSTSSCTLSAHESQSARPTHLKYLQIYHNDRFTPSKKNCFTTCVLWHSYAAMIDLQNFLLHKTCALGFRCWSCCLTYARLFNKNITKLVFQYMVVTFSKVKHMTTQILHLLIHGLHLLSHHSLFDHILRHEAVLCNVDIA